MKKRLPMLFAIAAISVNPNLMKKVETCTPASHEKAPLVYILKQWHLPPSINTKMNPPSANAKTPPQTLNQTQIYNQLSEWVKAGNVDTVVAEGCEGEIDDHFTLSFQGWSYGDLVRHAQDKNYSEILSHAVVKLKAKYPKDVHALCGDNLAEIKKSELALSDARADVGYFSRLSENQSKPEKLKLYLDGVVEVYHLPATSTAQDAMKAVLLDLKKSVGTFQDSTHARDVSFAKRLEDANSKKPTILVIGGLHAEDLKKILEEKKMNCAIFEPLAYQNDEEAMSTKLKALVH